MKAADLYRLMESPALLTEDTLQQLKQIVDEFPYFQIARMLYLKNLAVLNDIRFGAELKKMAIYVPDRRKLFTLIEGERFGLQLQSAKEENPTREDAFSLIDAFLSNREEEEPKTDASLLFQPSVSSDYIYWSLTKENGQVEEKEEEEEVRLQHHDLIDSFIKNEEQRTPGSGLNLDMETTGAPVPGNLAELEENQHKPLDDSYFTETLAHIYVKQKRYEKALQIIKNLNLKYPEKNVYFALWHTLHHYGPLWIIFALRCVHAVYIILIFPYCISSATIFPISTIFSPCFFGFSSAIFFSISIYCGFTSFYHYAALVVPFCTWLCFFLFSFALLM